LKWNTQQSAPPHQIRVEPPTPAASSPAKELGSPTTTEQDTPRGRRSSDGGVGATRKRLSGVSLAESKEMELNPSYRRRVGFDTFGAGTDLEGKAKATGGGTGKFSTRFVGWGEAILRSTRFTPLKAQRTDIDCMFDVL